MGHDEHFLSRLDRLSTPEIELALSLYRDTELLKYLLETARVPDNAERVAVCLSDETHGPYLVLTREGRFVTCLAEGMVPYGLYQIPRARLDATSQRVEVLRGRMAVALRKVGDGGDVRRFLRRIEVAGEDLSREEFLALCAWQPVMQRQFLRLLLNNSNELLDLRPSLSKIHRPNANERALLKRYHELFWSVAHLFVLLGIDDVKTFYADLPARCFAQLQVPATTFTWSATRQGVSSLAARGAWFAGRMGKAVAGEYKRGYHEANSAATVLNTGLGLMAIGASHARMSAEIAKTLDPGDKAPDPAIDPQVLAYKKMFATVFRVRREGPDTIETMIAQVGRAIGFGLSTESRSPRAVRFASPEEIPTDLACTLALRCDYDTMNEGDGAMFVSLLTAHTASFNAESFYLPESLVPTMRVEWTPERTRSLLSPTLRYYRVNSQTVRAEKVPGRNDPCTCGSGKKYKKCCS